MDRCLGSGNDRKIDMISRIYKLEGILMLGGGDLISASNFKDFYKIRFLYNSLSKSGNTI